MIRTTLAPSGAAPGGAAGGDLAGTYPNPTVAQVSGLNLYLDAANAVGERNGVNAQTFNVYNTFTDASNYERAVFRWSSNVFQIGTDAAGTGTGRAWALMFGGVSRWELNSGSFNPAVSLSYDMGAASRLIKNIYGGGGLTLGSATKTGAYTTTLDNYTILADATTAPFSVTLIAAPTTGQIQIIKKIDSSANAVTIAGNGKNIDGAANQVLSSQWSTLTLQYNATAGAWYIIGKV